jgi:UDP-perosamine 4-acetyltransferase
MVEANNSQFITSLSWAELASSRPRLIGLGAGGHAKGMIDVHKRVAQYHLSGLLDSNLAVGSLVQGVPVIGDDSSLQALVQQGIRHAFLGVGTTKNCRLRHRLWELLIENDLMVVHTIDPTAFISTAATYGTGLTAFARSTVQANATLGVNVLVNTAAVVEHDCRVADHVHIASGAILAGGVTIETGAMIGAGAVIKPGVHVGAWAVVGAGAVVVKDVAANSTVVGNPAKILNKEQRSWTISQAS